METQRRKTYGVQQINSKKLVAISAYFKKKAKFSNLKDLNFTPQEAQSWQKKGKN